jgi:16S rRNA (cytosine1402-N4)-methyltransferase
LIVDATLGGGGHTKIILDRVGPAGRVIGFDRDRHAIELAESWATNNLTLIASNYADIPEYLKLLKIDAVDAILLDLGLSSDQLQDDQRGFSYNSHGLLDLRFDMGTGEPAWRLVNRLGEKHLADLIYQYGEERFSRRIARKICEVRHNMPIKTADQLAAIVRACVPRAKHHSIDPATRTFQALRISVNDELKWLRVALNRLPDVLRPGGRLAVISFHSLEDRLVKQAMSEDQRLTVITRKPVVAAASELDQNPRSRSAKLRVAKRI